LAMKDAVAPRAPLRIARLLMDMGKERGMTRRIGSDRDRRRCVVVIVRPSWSWCGACSEMQRSALHMPDGRVGRKYVVVINVQYVSTYVRCVELKILLTPRGKSTWQIHVSNAGSRTPRGIDDALHVAKDLLGYANIICENCFLLYSNICSI
jgi:hypothetical protein